MKGILIEPGRAPEPANLPDTLSAMEARLGGTVEHYIFPRTTRLTGWRGGDIKPLSGVLLTEMLDRLKDTEVRV